MFSKFVYVCAFRRKCTKEPFYLTFPPRPSSNSKELILLPIYNEIIVGAASIVPNSPRAFFVPRLLHSRPISKVSVTNQTPDRIHERLATFRRIVGVDQKSESNDDIKTKQLG